MKRSEGGASFLPEDYVQSKAEHRASFIAVLMFSVVMFCIVSAFLITNRRWESVRTQQNEVNQAYQLQAKEIKQLEDLELQRADLMDKAELTTALIERVPRSVLLADLALALPAQITLQEMEIVSKRIRESVVPADKGQVKTLSRSTRVNRSNAKTEAPRPKVIPPRFEFSLSIVGTSTTNAAVADYLSALKSSPLLATADFEYIQDTVVDGRELRKFKIVATLRGEVSAEDVDRVRDRLGIQRVVNAGSLMQDQE
ncbi:MAG: PilN domain-containing protein [Phycisphaeraceae bacterium]|nr:PilN domain-containing protein [Phycisphaeraceae bacterium]MCW5755274.1 PilN domain-containing protein [Phycisphaeraceae bacterium]